MMLKSRAVCIFIALFMLVSLIPFAASAESIAPLQESDFTILWTTDPQWYSFKYQDILIDQNDWVVENYDRMNINYIIHTGDFVDLPHERAQWDFIDAQYKKWDDAGLEYGVLAGNHDVDGSDYTEFNEYFGTHRFEDKECFGEGYDGNRGHYDLLTAGGVDFIFVYLGYGTHTDADYEWMNGVLSEHSDRIAFLMFHEYLNTDGARTPVGNAIFERVVLANPNVRAVLCGHNYNATRLVDFIDDDGDGKEDRTVYQLMANYQNTPNGGNGFMRFLEFDVDGGTLTQRTYSPYLESFNFFENRGDDADEFGYRDEFTLPFDFSKPSAKNDGKKGAAISKPRVSFGGVSLPVNYINAYESGEGYNNAGVYDFNYSLDARDALKTKENVYYIAVDFADRIGYTVSGIYDNAERLASIPQNGRVIVISRDAVDYDGNKFDIGGIKLGDNVSFGQLDKLSSPKASTHIKLYIRGLSGSFAIDGFNSDAGANEWVIFDRGYGESTGVNGAQNTKNALIAFTPIEGDEGRYIATEAITDTSKPKDMKIPEKGFVLAINADSSMSSFKSSVETLLIEGIQVILTGYAPEGGLVYGGESIISKNASDWVYGAKFVFEEANDSIVFSNTDGLWPDARYTPSEPISFNPKTCSVFYDFDMEKSSKTSVVLFFENGASVKLNPYFEGATISTGSGDVKGEGKTLNGVIHLSGVEFPSGAVSADGTVSIKSIQIFASGDAGKKMTLRELRIIDRSEASFVLPQDFAEADIHDGIGGNEQEESIPEAVSETDSGSGNEITIFVIAAVVIVAAAVALVLIKKRK